MKPDVSTVPRLAPGVRLADRISGQAGLLLMPERVLRLNESSLAIVELCDGKRTVQQILEELRVKYAKAEPVQIMDDLIDYLQKLNEARAIDF
jgi:pyrroloquinoline quinone biosynthesis protein D